MFGAGGGSKKKSSGGGQKKTSGYKYGAGYQYKTKIKKTNADRNSFIKELEAKSKKGTINKDDKILLKNLKKVRDQKKKSPSGLKWKYITKKKTSKKRRA